MRTFDRGGSGAQPGARTGGGAADRRDARSGPAQPRDHALLLAARAGGRPPHRGRRELVHVRDLGLQAGRQHDPRRGRRGAAADTPRPPCRVPASDPVALALAAPARPAGPDEPARPPRRRAPHALRRARAGERRRRARQPEGLRGDRAGVRPLRARLPSGRGGASNRSSIRSLLANHPTGSSSSARRSGAINA